MTVITGDIHGGRGFLRLAPDNIVPHGLPLPTEVIVLGDFGLIWNAYPDAQEREWTDYLDSLPYSILSLLGNHENFERIYSLPIETRYDGPVYRASRNVAFLKHGHSYNIGSRSYFVFGGAASIDKKYRTEGESWWPEEIPTEADYQQALKTIAKHNGKFDYILTHTAPTAVFHQFLTETHKHDYGFKDPTQDMLDILESKLIFKEWYFGHFHDNHIIIKDGKNFRMLFEENLIIQ
jgi:hypothetical protein